MEPALQATRCGVTTRSFAASEEVLATLGIPPPWVHVAARYWVWHAGKWAVAEPQPAPEDEDNDGWAWPGTVCEDRRHHALAALGPVRVCEDCHHVSD